MKSFILMSVLGLLNCSVVSKSQPATPIKIDTVYETSTPNLEIYTGVDKETATSQAYFLMHKRHILNTLQVVEDTSKVASNFTEEPDSPNKEFRRIWYAVRLRSSKERPDCTLVEVWWSLERRPFNDPDWHSEDPPKDYMPLLKSDIESTFTRRLCKTQEKVDTLVRGIDTYSNPLVD